MPFEILVSTTNLHPYIKEMDPTNPSASVAGFLQKRKVMESSGVGTAITGVMPAISPGVIAGAGVIAGGVIAALPPTNA